MRKKIYDILPPNRIGKEEVKTEEPTEEIEIEIKEKPAFRQQEFRKPKSFFGGKLLIIFIVLVIGGLIGFYFLTDTKAEIVIYPKTEQLNAEKDVVITTDENYAQSDESETFVLVGKVVSEEKDYTAQIKATGSAGGGGMAKGILKVYNDQKPAAPLSLVKGTHFLSEKGGKSYHSLTVINIPAGKDGEPGFVEIEVEADEPGEEYNVDSTKFSVPKLAGTDYYTTTWAEIATPITGGVKSTKTAVSQNDVATAKDKFKSQQLENIKNQLLPNIPDDYLLIENATVQDVTDFVVKAKAGDEVDSFNVSGTIKTQIIAVKKDDLNRLLNLIAGSGQSFDYTNLKVTANKISEKSGKFEINLTISADYSKLGETDSLESGILGKSKDEAIAILKKNESIEKVDIKINPMWKNAISTNKDNVTIKIEAIKE